jgi:DHA1 family multidrug resistance protein-like MFS transporter
MVISWKRNLYLVWISQLLAMAGFSAITPFIPVFIRDRFGILDEQTRGAWVSALTFFGMFSYCVSAPLWGFLADRFGRKLMLLRSYYVTAFLFPLLYFSPNMIVMIMLRFCVSAFSGTVTAAQTLVVTTTPEEHHGYALGVLSTAVWSGNMFGFMAGALIVNYCGYFWGFAVCGIMYLLGGLLVQFFVKENFVRQPKPKVSASGAKKSGWRRIFPSYSTSVWLMLLLFVLMGLSRRYDEPYLALLVESIYGSENTSYYTGLISAGAALGGVISGVVLGRLCDRYSPLKLAYPIIVLSFLFMLWQAGAQSLLSLGIARFACFMAAGGLEPAFQALLARMAPPEQRGILFGVASSLRMTGILLAALSGGFVIYFLGTRAVFLVAALLMISLLPLLYCSTRCAPRGAKIG